MLKVTHPSVKKEDVLLLKESVAISQADSATETALDDILNNPQALVHTIQKGKGNKLPFFFLHGDWNGGPFYCFTLARTMGREQPFYALDPYKFSGSYLPLSFSAMAAVYIKAVRAIQPHGPYMLGGFCNGALVVHEMARQLKEQGEEISLLLIITPSRLSPATGVAYRAIHRLGGLVHINVQQQWHAYLRVRHMALFIYRKLRPPSGPLRKDYLKMLEGEPRLNSMFPPVEALYKDYSGMYTWLAGTYNPTYSDPSIKFIWSSEEMEHRVLWKRFEQSNDDIPVIPGPHMSCITDHLDILADLMKTYVKDAQMSAVQVTESPIVHS